MSLDPLTPKLGVDEEKKVPATEVPQQTKPTDKTVVEPTPPTPVARATSDGITPVQQLEAPVVTPPVVPPLTTSKGNLTIRAPKPGSTVRNPVHILAEFSEKALRIEVWENGTKVIQQQGSVIDKVVKLPRANLSELTIQAVLKDDDKAEDSKVLQTLTVNVR